jgi:hypothetical protein
MAMHSPKRMAELIRFWGLPEQPDQAMMVRVYRFIVMGNGSGVEVQQARIDLLREKQALVGRRARLRGSHWVGPVERVVPMTPHQVQASRRALKHVRSSEAPDALCAYVSLKHYANPRPGSRYVPLSELDLMPNE